MSFEPAASTESTTADPLEVAHALRRQAFRSCVALNWYTCLEDLDLAREIDPAGEGDPLVKAARADAADAIDGAHKEGGPRRFPIYAKAVR